MTLKEFALITFPHWAFLARVNSFEMRFFIKDQFTMGRHPLNDVHCSDGLISGRHCIVSRQYDSATNEYKVWLEDLSANGTYINGVKVSMLYSDKTVLLDWQRR